MLRRAFFALPLVAALPARAQSDWRADMKEIRFGITSAENDKDAVTRFENLARYMEARLGVKVRIYRSTDYAGTVEALAAGHLEFATMGPASYALANKVMGDRITPIARSLDQDGSEGYYSVVVVKADSPAKSLDDLKGKSFAFADPNSTSGYAFPSFFLKKQGYDPAKFFSRTGFSGSHELSVIAVLNGTYDAAATFWTNERRGNVQRMTEKGMIPAGAIRIIWTSPLIPNSPWVTRTALPEALRRDFTTALFAMPKEDAAAWRTVSSGAAGLVAAKHEDYLDVIEVVRALDAERKRKGA
ncbi:MAG TPA: phosphonate ABC transporter substrate-binding protein [Acidisoma sp.]|uniref:phosphonate ABC transporter substrate-binding protein n=1 Tax=Acidisoma sp. TaxID=1872115 RepID=UPI002C04D70A|nr:phosphonate ABC transporter substrate-binding protein [Acidisoma sp.]HTI01880.1 phosphonate ABC transporter substrate-binding protein [Acidisoma sp.]